MSTINSPAKTDEISCARLARRDRFGDQSFNLPLAQIDSGAATLVVTLTSSTQARDEAQALVNRRYACQGYGSDHPLAGRGHETIFTAQCDGSLVGTVTLAADSDRGLDVDLTFPEELQFLRRQPNLRLCEMKELAVEYKSAAKPLLGALFHFIFIYGTHNYLGTDLLIQVNPRHAPFYEKMLGFKNMGSIKINMSVNAPSQLISLSVSAIESALQHSRTAPNDPTLYKYFYQVYFSDRIVHQLNERRLDELRVL